MVLVGVVMMKVVFAVEVHAVASAYLGRLVQKRRVEIDICPDETGSPQLQTFSNMP